MVWQATGLIPYNLSIIFDKISTNYTKCNTIPSTNTLIHIRFFSDQISQTPRNIEKIEEIEEFILLFCYQTLDFLKLTLLYKTLKAARLAMTDRVVLNCTNTELFAANTWKKQQAQHTSCNIEIFRIEIT